MRERNNNFDEYYTRQQQNINFLDGWIRLSEYTASIHATKFKVALCTTEVKWYVKK